MDWALVLSFASKAYEGVKALRNIDKNFDEATFKLQIADLNSTLADLKNAITDARTEADERDAEIQRLREAFTYKAENTVLVRGLRYESDEHGKPIGMPFCLRCEQVDGRLMRIVGTSSGKDGYKAVCPLCKADFGREHGYHYPAPPV